MGHKPGLAQKLVPACDGKLQSVHGCRWSDQHIEMQPLKSLQREPARICNKHHVVQAWQCGGTISEASVCTRLEQLVNLASRWSQSLILSTSIIQRFTSEPAATVMDNQRHSFLA